MKNYRKFIGLFYILAAFIVIPVYNKGTFNRLSRQKVEAFYLISGIAFVAYFLFSVIYSVRRKNIVDQEIEIKEFSNDPASHRLNIHILDVSLIMFLAANTLSTFLSARIKDAFFGVPGVGMGLLSMLIMVISYFFISKNVRLEGPVIHTIALFSIFPVLYTIINRLGYDPLNMFYDWENAKSRLYVSTFGNYSAYSGYLSIIIPIVCFMAFFAESKKVRLCYLALFVIDLISILMVGTTSIIVCTLITLLIIFFWKFAPQVTLNRELITGAMIVVALSYATCVSYGLYHPDFANERGFIWDISLDMFRSFSLKQKLFGVGTNCYMYSLTDFIPTNFVYLAAYNEKFGNLILTTAYSEYLDCLVNSGLFGLLSYVFVMYAALRKYSEKEEVDMSTRLSFLCVVSYLFYVMVNFSNVLATPFFFIFLGTLAYE